jgi:hypothetical protein
MTILTTILLSIAMHTNPAAQPGFLGLRVGMKAATALAITDKKPDALEQVKPHSGQRVLSDVLSLTDCELSMHRSLGFDSSGTLTAVGLTYKTIPDRGDDARDCAFQWLKKTYGPPTSEPITDSVKQEVWQYAGVKLTLEAKQYNPHDVFVLIYYYKEDTNGRANTD